MPDDVFYSLFHIETDLYFMELIPCISVLTTGTKALWFIAEHVVCKYWLFNCLKYLVKGEAIFHQIRTSPGAHFGVIWSPLFQGFWVCCTPLWAFWWEVDYTNCFAWNFFDFLKQLGFGLSHYLTCMNVMRVKSGDIYCFTKNLGA